ncbi:MAG: pyrimidine 5'-nucleotidase, partial [Rhodospirillales bacterium]|nr:pyrimidine 5'-nucleotidase [Rhodospirillales bacterium]
MTSFISGFLGLSLEEAVQIRKAYYRDHGTTLNGLMTLHGLEPGEYLDFVHDIDLGVISPDLGLERA